ncbi:hypothetical protein SH139x_001612 [Planctomycetaceae bacterium SH139]
MSIPFQFFEIRGPSLNSQPQAYLSSNSQPQAYLSSNSQPQAYL